MKTLLVTLVAIFLIGCTGSHSRYPTESVWETLYGDTIQITDYSGTGHWFEIKFLAYDDRYDYATALFRDSDSSKLFHRHLGNSLFNAIQNARSKDTVENGIANQAAD